MKAAKYQLEENKNYAWCSCGLSKKNPFCDGSHNKISEGEEKKQSLKFKVEKTGEYMLCMCKKTQSPPFAKDCVCA